MICGRAGRRGLACRLCAPFCTSLHYHLLDLSHQSRAVIRNAVLDRPFDTAAVGQLDEEEIFYLESRGLNPALARNLLTYGFAEEVIEKIKIDSIKRELNDAVLHRLHSDLAVS